ncbi:MAG TPA: hypothetical protein VFB60_11790 [Ktedonobacteraceae bacterium]|nr:hypothetical protein [Ktedonobacteraceae bacterium]
MSPRPKPVQEMTMEQLQARRLEMVDIMDTLEIVHVSELPYERRKEHTDAMHQARRLLTAIEGEITKRMALAISQYAQEIVLPEQEQPEEKENE